MNNAQFICYLEGLLLKDIFAIDESTWMKAFNYFIYLYCTIIILSFLRLLIYPFHWWFWHSILRLFSPKLLSFLLTNCGPIPQKRCGCLWVRSRGPSHLWSGTFWILHYQDIWIEGITYLVFLSDLKPALGMGLLPLNRRLTLLSIPLGLLQLGLSLCA